MQRALRFTSTASLTKLSSLGEYLERVPSTQGTGRSRIFKHNSILFVHADQCDDVRSLPLVVRAEQLGVEVLLVDEADARHFASNTSFRHVPFEALTNEALNEIEEREQGEPSKKKQKKAGPGWTTMSKKISELIKFQVAQSVRRLWPKAHIATIRPSSTPRRARVQTANAIFTHTYGLKRIFAFAVN